MLILLLVLVFTTIITTYFMTALIMSRRAWGSDFDAELRRFAFGGSGPDTDDISVALSAELIERSSYLLETG